MILFIILYPLVIFGAAFAFFRVKSHLLGEFHEVRDAYNRVIKYLNEEEWKEWTRPSTSSKSLKRQSPPQA